MSRFIYSAKKGPKEKISGVIEAHSQAQAIALLEQKGLFPISIEQQDKAGTMRAVSGRVRRQELAVFVRQFSNLIEAGLTIVQALNILIQQTANPTLKNMAMDVGDRIKDGATLSESLGNHPKHFSQFFCAVIRAGEISGTLEVVFNHLADYLESEERVRSDIFSSLSYPILILSVGFLTIYGLLTFVVPRLAEIFVDMGQALPLPTLLLINISNIFKNYWWLFLAFFAIVIFMVKRPKGKEEKLFWDKLILGLPAIGKVVNKSEMAHFVSTLSLLLGSGVAMLFALEAVGNTVRNEAIRLEIKNMASNIKDGASLSSSIKKCSYFPAYVANIVGVGEESGTLEKSLQRIAVSYEQELARLTRTMTALLEPVMILVMGLIVAFIVVAMLLPIFQINLMAG